MKKLMTNKEVERRFPAAYLELFGRNEPDEGNFELVPRDEWIDEPQLSGTMDPDTVDDVSPGFILVWYGEDEPHALTWSGSGKGWS